MKANKSNVVIGFAAALLFTVLLPASSVQAVCGDVDGSGTVTVTDALRVLKKSVGQSVTMDCPVCGSTTTSTSTTTTTTLPPPARCLSNSSCRAGEYCLKKTGTCRTLNQGTCEVKPQFCRKVFDPVCGCDGTTYGSSCLAAQAGVNVDHLGACAPATTTTTSTTTTTLVFKKCRDNSACSKLEYCDLPDGQCTTGLGVCRTRPFARACSLQPSDPVCGCDGKAYGNPCEANAAGTSIRNKGRLCGLIP